MYKFLLTLAMCLSGGAANAQDFWNPNTNNHIYYNPPNAYYGYTPHVTYVPVVQWYPTGTWLNVGPVVVSPDRRYVRLGINAGFTDYYGVSTFNFYNGQTNFYPTIR
jgi:hypothetical protein